jgi:hypothetical protein
VAVACDIHAERHLAKAGGSKRKLRGIPTLGTRAEAASGKGGAKRRSAQANRVPAGRSFPVGWEARKIGETACGRGRGSAPLGEDVAFACFSGACGVSPRR